MEGCKSENQTTERKYNSAQKHSCHNLSIFRNEMPRGNGNYNSDPEHEACVPPCFNIGSRKLVKNFNFSRKSIFKSNSLKTQKKTKMNKQQTYSYSIFHEENRLKTLKVHITCSTMSHSLQIGSNKLLINFL